MQVRYVVAVSLLACLAGSSDGADDRTSPTSHVQVNGKHGSFTPDERAMAVTIAEDAQSKITGTFVGATAFATRGTPFDRDSACDVDRRFINVRLVWESDASFVHSGPPGVPPDGPRKSLLVTVDPTTGDTCEIGAQYRHVGASANETLLYGQWPDPADG